MGRVHKAMRRAAGGAGGGEATTGTRGDFAESAFAEFDLDTAELADADAGPAVMAEPPAEEPPPAAEALIRDPAGPNGVVQPTGSPAPAPPAHVAAPAADSVLDHIDASASEKVVVDARMMPASKEQYRRLAAALHRAQDAADLKVVMIASAAAAEGKTLTACNLALTLSESYRKRVLLIDADLRRPALHRMFRLDAPSGLADGLAAESQHKLPLHAVSDRLTVLPAGHANADPMAGLTSPRMRRVLDEAREAFDWIIIDTPPVGLMTDANLLASMADGTILVIKAGQTPCDLVRRVADSLREHGHLLGVVLNRATMFDARHGYGYGYGDYRRYYGAAAPDTANTP